MNFESGYEYPCMLNGKHRIFTVTDHMKDSNWFEIMWDDGDYERASRKDMERWCMGLVE